MTTYTRKRGNKLVFVLVFLLFLTGCTPTAMVVHESIPHEQNNANIEVYFCPEDDCERILYDFLDSAEDSINCALFDLDLSSIIQLLEEKNARIITDDDNFENIEHLRNVKHDNRSALMHQKFCVIDSKKIFTGSFNPTENGAYKNNNNMLLIESKILAQNYEDEFQEMWSGQFGRGNHVEVPVFFLNQNKIQNYFCPEDDCARKIQQELRKANHSIYFTAFSFTHEGIATELLLKHHEGLDVRGVFEKTRISKYSRYSLLEYHGVDVIKDHNKYAMHHKFIIIDNRTVITGSFNPSKNADYRNDENIVIVEDEKLAAKYIKEFNSLY